MVGGNGVYMYVGYVLKWHEFVHSLEEFQFWQVWWGCKVHASLAESCLLCKLGVLCLGGGKINV